jgi:predicted nucleic acid-binding Zn ribbon protein
MVRIQKNASCPNCSGILKKTEGRTDIIIRCAACGAKFKVVDITEFDKEFVCEEVKK